MALGLLAFALALPGVRIGPAHLDAHTLLFGSLGVIVGFQSIVFFLATKAFAIAEGLLPRDPALSRVIEAVHLEEGLLAGGVLALAGAALLLEAVNDWRLAAFGPLDYGHTMRVVIPGATLVAVGVQVVLASFLVSLLAMQRR